MPDPTAATSVRDFVVPDLGEGLEDATLVEWRVSPDDEVALNQTLCVLETAKAEVEIPSPFAGRVVECNGAPGDTLDVGTVLARIEVSGSQASAAPPVAADPAPEPPDDGSGANLVGYGTSTGTSRRRRARRSAGGGGPADAVPVVDPTAGATDPRPETSHARAKPKARKLARELGVDIEALAPGSGPDGTVTRADVLDAADAPSVVQDAPTDVRSAPQKPDLEDAVVPVLGIRARIADHLTTSHTTIPAASASVEVDCTRLLAVRATMNADNVRRGDDPFITPFSLLLRLLVVAVQHNPSLNASYDVDQRVIRFHGEVHLGRHRDRSRARVPVVRSAQQLTVLELSAEPGAWPRLLARPAWRRRSWWVRPSPSPTSGRSDSTRAHPSSTHPRPPSWVSGRYVNGRSWSMARSWLRPTATITCSFDHRVSDGRRSDRSSPSCVR